MDRATGASTNLVIVGAIMSKNFPKAAILAAFSSLTCRRCR